jgi:uncharacterized membrane protein YhaH (DUF805 family)
MNYYFDVFKKYALLKGRSMRVEFWVFTLINVAINFCAGALSAYLGNAANNYLVGNGGNLDIILIAWRIVLIPFLIYVLITIIPWICVSVRRLHDTNHSGWWLLMSAIPWIGQIWLLILLIADSQARDNKYGPNPKKVAAISK